MGPSSSSLSDRLCDRPTLSKSLVSLALISLTYRGELRSVPQQACSWRLGRDDFYRAVPHAAECPASWVPSQHAGSTSESSEGPKTSPPPLTSFLGGRHRPLERPELPFVSKILRCRYPDQSLLGTNYMTSSYKSRGRDREAETEGLVRGTNGNSVNRTVFQHILQL